MKRFWHEKDGRDPLDLEENDTEANVLFAVNSINTSCMISEKDTGNCR